MTHTSFFQNFFVPLCASLSDDEFLAFASTVLANLERPGADPAGDAPALKPLVEKLQAAHEQRGPQGKSAPVATLAQATRSFLAWVKLTNTTRVFPAFPSATQPERLAIFPGGMDTLYKANQSNILERAKYYLDKVSASYGKQTGVAVADADAQYALLEAALTSRRTHGTAVREGSAAVDVEEAAVCGGLYLVYTGLLRQHHAQPEQAYAYFPFPRSKGQADDANLPSLPTT